MGAYYLIGLPLAGTLGFAAGLGARGMVLGMLCGKLCHAVAFVALAVRTDWQNQVRKAAARVRSESGHANTGKGGGEEGDGDGDATQSATCGVAGVAGEDAAPKELAVADGDLDSGCARATSEVVGSKGRPSSKSVRSGARAMRYAQLDESRDP